MAAFQPALPLPATQAASPLRTDAFSEGNWNMTWLCATLKKLVCQESGATLVEYALMLLLMALALFTVVKALGIAAEKLFHVPPFN
jgi:Flp pilus assembly pilin Flp